MRKALQSLNCGDPVEPLAKISQRLEGAIACDERNAELQRLEERYSRRISKIDVFARP